MTNNSRTVYNRKFDSGHFLSNLKITLMKVNNVGTVLETCFASSGAKIIY